MIDPDVGLSVNCTSEYSSPVLVPAHYVSVLGHVICFGQWGLSKSDAVSGWISMYTLFSWNTHTWGPATMQRSRSQPCGKTMWRGRGSSPLATPPLSHTKSQIYRQSHLTHSRLIRYLTSATSAVPNKSSRRSAQLSPSQCAES